MGEMKEAIEAMSTTAEMKGDKTEAIQEVIQLMTEAEEAEFKLGMDEFVAEMTGGKTAAEKERWMDGLLLAKKNLGLLDCFDAAGWKGCKGCKGCEHLREFKKRALDAEVEKAQDEAIAIRRANNNPHLEQIVPDVQMAQVIQGNCSSSSSGACCEECARAAPG